jgi:hypothetical protein
MAKIDRFAAFRPAQIAVDDLFSSIPHDADASQSPPVPAAWGPQNPQKTAMSPASPLSPELERRWRGKFPLTEYMVALMKHPDIEQADPGRAAEWYGLSGEVCRSYLEDEKRRRRAHG